MAKIPAAGGVAVGLGGRGGRLPFVRGSGGEGGVRRVGGEVGGRVLLCSERGVNNKWPGPHLIGSDFNPMFHHKLVERGECLGFGLSITDMCRQADTIISLIVTSPAQ